jgi:hypothetical protein
MTYALDPCCRQHPYTTNWRRRRRKKKKEEKKEEEEEEKKKNYYRNDYHFLISKYTKQ